MEKQYNLSKNQKIILDLIVKSSEPLKAYSILYNVQKKGIKAPLQVYRALDKLVEIGKDDEIKSLNSASALWMRNKKDIKSDQYEEFYNHLGGIGKPWKTIHNTTEGIVSWFKISSKVRHSLRNHPCPSSVLGRLKKRCISLQIIGAESAFLAMFKLTFAPLRPGCSAWPITCQR